MRRCPECGKFAGESETTCNNCGYPFNGKEEVVEVKQCLECGEYVEINAESCSKCGHPFGDWGREDIEAKIKAAEEAEKAAQLAEQKALELEQKMEKERKRQEAEERLREANRKIEEAKRRMKELEEKAAAGTGADAAQQAGVQFQQMASDKGLNSKPRKKRMGLIIALCCIGLAVILAIGFGVYKLTGNRSKDVKMASLDAYKGKDGTVYFPTVKGVVSFKEDIKLGYSTPNQDKFVILDNDGSLYYYKSEKAEKEKLASNVEGIWEVQNKGVVYTVKKEATVEDVLKRILKELNEKTGRDYDYEDVEEAFNEYYSDGTVEDAEEFYELLLDEYFLEDQLPKEYYIVYFKDKKIIDLETIYLSTAADSLSAAGVTADGDIVSYTEGEEKVRKIAKAGDYTQILNVSDNGKKVVWSEDDGGETVIYLSTGENKEKLGSLGVKPEYEWVSAERFNGEKDIIISGRGYENIIILMEGKEPVCVKLGDPISYKGILGSDGKSLKKESRDIDGFYVLTYDEEGMSNAYYIDTEGNKEKLLSNINHFEGASDGKMLYIDDEDNLYIADAEKNKLKNETRITSDVEDISVTYDGKYVYVTKEDILYYIDLSDKEYSTEKIADDVSSVICTTDCKTIYYFTEEESIEDTYYETKVLNRFHVDDGSARITSDVVEMIKPYESYVVPESSPVVLKFQYLDDEENPVCDIGTVQDGEFHKAGAEVWY